MIAAARFVCQTCGITSERDGTCERGHATLADASDDALLGTEVGGYCITRRIGRGGMGAVYRAVQPAIDAEVAIKILAADLAGDPESTERFIAEARIANLVRHEALVKVLGLGVLPDGRPYQVMEHLTGVPLADVIYDHQRRPLGTLVERLAEALRAIHVMHARGIIHRDLKPSNLFATTAGFLKVLDFGIAKLAEHRGGLTRTGHSIGTPGYMSPEQASAERVDARTDLYAMGVVLFEAIARRRPFEGRVVEALALGEAPPRLAGAVPEATPALDTIIAKAMAIDPAGRYRDAEEMARALEAAARELPASAFGPLLDEELVARASGPLVPNSTPSHDPTAPPTVGSPRRAATETRRATPRTTSAEPTKQQLGRFVIERAVAEGGEGQVLLAVDPAIQRKVALKLVRSGSPERRERMVAEARAMAKVNHPNVVTLYELGDDGGQLFLAMEYLDAIDLARWLAERPRPWSEIVRMFVEAGRGLAAAHAAGITHRDFKPANVLLGADGRPKVGDFGIANSGGDAEGGQGTLAYMPPEQLEGGAADPRSDQFAFCASLWHALYGTPPFARPEMSAMAIALAVHKGTPRHGDRGPVPQAIDHALRRGLAADPAARFPSMDALLAALAPPSGRRWALWIGASLVVAAAAIGTVLVLLRSTGPPASPPDEPVLTLGEIAKLRPVDRLRAIARQPRSIRTSDAARILIGDTVATTGIVRTVTLPGDPIMTTLASSQTGRWIGVALSDGVWLQAFDAIGKRVATLTLPPVPETPYSLEIDEEAGEIRALGFQTIYRASLRGGPWATLQRCSTKTIDRAVSDPHLKHLLCIEGEPGALLETPASRLLFSQDGRYVAKLGTGPIELRDLQTKSPPAVIEAPPGSFVSLGVHTLAIAEADGVRLRDHATGQESRWSAGPGIRLREVHILGEYPTTVLVTFSDQRIATLESESDGSVSMVHVTLPTAGTLRGLRTQGGRVIASYAERTVVDDSAWGTSWELSGASGAITSDHYGTRIAILDGRTLRIWDVAHRRPVVIWTGGSVIGLGRSALVVDAPYDPELRLHDVNDPLAPKATLHVPPRSHLLGGASPGAFWRRPDGTVWEWIPGLPTRSLGTYPRVPAIFQRGQTYFGLERRRELFDLTTGKHVCAEEPDFVHALSQDARSALAFREGKGVSICDPVTQLHVPLEITMDEALGMNWQFGSDGSLLFATPTGSGPLRTVAVFEVRSGKRVPTPALDGSRRIDLLDGNHQGLAVQSGDGTFWISPSGPTRLHDAAADAATSFDVVARRVLHRDSRMVTVWDVSGSPTSREVARISALATPIGRLFSFDRAIGIEQRRVSQARSDISIWSLDPPPVEDTELWLALAAD